MKNKLYLHLMIAVAILHVLWTKIFSLIPDLQKSPFSTFFVKKLHT